VKLGVFGGSMKVRYVLFLRSFFYERRLRTSSVCRWSTQDQNQSTGKTYRTQRGINNLCYRGNWYTLSEVVPSGTMPYKMGVINLNMGTPVQVQTPDEG
jgi:hypothetical protein